MNRVIINRIHGLQHPYFPYQHRGRRPRATMAGMIRSVFIAAFTLTQFVSQAHAEDALNSAECRAARVRLDAALAGATGKADASTAELKAARTQAAADCFKQASDEPSGKRAPQAPIAVRPSIGLQPAAQLRAQPLPAMPQILAPRLPVITSCDAGGCWDSNGARLNRTGPGLSGPNGLCNVQGRTANCP